MSPSFEDNDWISFKCNFPYAYGIKIRCNTLAIAFDAIVIKD